MMFKKLLLVGAGLITTASYGERLPLVEKVNQTGFTMVEDVRTTSCKVFPNYVLLTTKFGGSSDFSFTSEEIRWVKVSEGVNQILQGLVDEKLSKKDSFICDTPSTTINAYVDGEKTVLFQSGACGAPRLDRLGPGTRMLKELVNAFCPKTNDFAGGGLQPILEPR